jgi:CspA family cold shock protein
MTPRGAGRPGPPEAVLASDYLYGAEPLYSGGMASTNGTVKRLVSDKGFGFVAAADGNEYFFHQSSCAVPFDQLREGDSVTFETGQGPKGPRAENVRKSGS